MIDAIVSLVAPPGVSSPAADGAAGTADAGALFASALAAAEGGALCAEAVPATALPLPLSDTASGALPAGHSTAPDTAASLVETLTDADGDAPANPNVLQTASRPSPAALLTALAHTEIAKAKQAADAIDRALAQWIDQLPAMPMTETAASEAVAFEVEAKADIDEDDPVADEASAERLGLPLPMTIAPVTPQTKADQATGAAPVAPPDDKALGKALDKAAAPSGDSRGELKTLSRSGPPERKPAAPRAEATATELSPAPVKPATAPTGLPAAEPAAAVTPTTASTPRTTIESASPTALPTPHSAAASSPAHSVAAAPSTASTFQAQLSAAIDSPAFGAALGIQISTLVDNGITEARLHLNPAEFGPIAVQIGLDGAQAQVHMAVEHAHTRQTLEQAMPELVQALHDAGFTMTGGGVSQQPRDGAPSAPPSSGLVRLGDEAADGTIAAAPAARRLQGMVDLYA